MGLTVQDKYAAMIMAYGSPLDAQTIKEEVTAYLYADKEGRGLSRRVLEKAFELDRLNSQAARQVVDELGADESLTLADVNRWFSTPEGIEGGRIYEATLQRQQAAAQGEPPKALDGLQPPRSQPR